jgi:hypothetical protein
MFTLPTNIATMEVRMADLETFKRRVGYHVGADQDAFTGNGSRKAVQLRHENG